MQSPPTGQVTFRRLLPRALLAAPLLVVQPVAGKYLLLRVTSALTLWADG